MATTSYEQALRVAEALPREEQLRLIQELAEHTAHDGERATSVMELCGLGQEIWQHRDAQEYVNSERASWNG
ncbi:MAG: hypothetical protein JWQ42_2023 [Edaphobacter sp.]|nr:hypothetical protein [Edaphobacter sp.]